MSRKKGTRSLWRRAQGRLAALCLAVCVVAATAPGLFAEVGKAEAVYDKSVALVIGIEQYLMAPPVPGAVEEAKQVARVLRQLGFEEITELYSKAATSRRVHQVLADMLTKQAGRMGRMVVFFAGHTGIARDGKGRDVGYLVPVDVQLNNAGKSLSVETFKDFTRRSGFTHTVLIVDGPFRGWDAGALKPMGPQMNAETRTVQVIAAADKGEQSARTGGKTLFGQALITGLLGEADLDQNGWLTVSELGAYIKRQVDAASSGAQHVTSVRIEGNGDAVLLRKAARIPVHESASDAPSGREAAKAQYEQALALLQGGKYAEEALARLERAIQADPTFGPAYILKSYLRLEVLPQLDEALAAAEQAVKHAPEDSEAFYTLGLIQEKLGHHKEAEQAFLQAAKLNPDNPEVYFALGTLYADQLADHRKSIEAFRRYLELGGAHGRARAAVSQADEAGSRAPGSSEP